jgi:branched-chain amino acid transport system substrate-binding protein
MKKCLFALLFYFASLSAAHADITIGLASSFTGSNAFFGEQMKRGAEQAVADINESGGVNGQKLILQQADDACDPKQGVTIANQFVSKGIKYIVGHACSSASIPASKVYAEENVLMVTPVSTNPALTEAGLKNIFRTCGRDDQQGSADGQYILKHFRGKKIAITHDQSAWGIGVANQLKKTLNEGGVQETLFESFTSGEHDYTAFVSKLKQAGIEVAFLGGYQVEVGLIVRQMKEQGAHIQVIGGDALVTQEFWSITGDAADGLLMSFGPDPRKISEAQQAIAAIRKSGYEPEGYTLYSYAAIQTIAEGIHRAGDDPVKAADALRSAPIKTVIGEMNFDSKGDRSGSTYVLYRWHNGKYAEAGD